MNLPNKLRPGTYLYLQAFNLIPGAAFAVADDKTDDLARVEVVMSLTREPNTERIHLVTRQAERVETGLPGDPALVYHHDLDYMEPVCLVGIVVNPDDYDDNNWGSW